MAREETDSCGSHLQLLLSLPEDVLSVLSGHLAPRDLCNLSLCCRRLRPVFSSDKLWLVQCSLAADGVRLPHRHLLRWRPHLASYRALCRFLLAARPLLGIWVHQNPELGNLVFVMLGFLSLVACRVIPQELPASGICAGPLLWAPVFEIAAANDGSPVLFLHGRDGGADHLCPASLRNVGPACNILLLEAEPSPPTPPPAASPSFARLAFGDRRKLLELVADQGRLKMPDSLSSLPLFPRFLEEEGDLDLLSERRSLLIQMHRVGRLSHSKNWGKMIPGVDGLDKTLVRCSKKKPFDCRSRISDSNSANTDEENSHISATGGTAKRGVAGYLRGGLKHIFKWSNSSNDSSSSSSLFSRSSSCSNVSNESRHIPLHEFIREGATVSLILRAAMANLSWYRAWPNMLDNRFALYKLPVQSPTAGKELAGLWGGSFGWPPGRPTAQDKTGTALFFIVISYADLDGHPSIVGTKILEGTHYVLHPNGSAMFVARVQEPAEEPFPWNSDEDLVRRSYSGEGIANGYGFRYPGSKPGSLFETQNGILAFVWRESRSVLALRRVDLQEVLRRGEQVPPLPLVANFSYLTKSYSNVFTSFASASSSLPSP